MPCTYLFVVLEHRFVTPAEHYRIFMQHIDWWNLFAIFRLQLTVTASLQLQIAQQNAHRNHKWALHRNMHTWICRFCTLCVIFMLETQHHTSPSPPEHHKLLWKWSIGVWTFDACNFFHNISTKCTRSSAFLQKTTTNKRRIYMLLYKMTRFSQKEWSVECLTISFGLHWPLRLIFYFSRCSQTGAWDPALYIPARHRVCCMMKGGGCSGPARLILSQGTRRVNCRLCCCPGLPGFPRENIQRGYRRIRGERHTELFIEQVRRRGEERKRARVKKLEEERQESLEADGRAWYLQLTASEEIWVDVFNTCWAQQSPQLFLECPAGAKANRLCLVLLTYGREGSRRG